MPHFKCELCRTRLYRVGSGDPVGDLCPGCGSLLDPVAELGELVGFRLVGAHRGADGGASTHQRLADQLGELIVRRQAAYAATRAD